MACKKIRLTPGLQIIKNNGVTVIYLEKYLMFSEARKCPY